MTINEYKKIIDIHNRNKKIVREYRLEIDRQMRLEKQAEIFRHNAMNYPNLID